MPTLRHSKAKMPINLPLPYRKSWSTLYVVKFLLRHIYVLYTTSLSELVAKIIQKCPYP